MSFRILNINIICHLSVAIDVSSCKIIAYNCTVATMKAHANKKYRYNNGCGIVETEEGNVKNAMDENGKFKHILVSLIYINALNMLVQIAQMDSRVKPPSRPQYFRCDVHCARDFLLPFLSPHTYSTNFRWNYINHLHLINKFSIPKKDFARQFTTKWRKSTRKKSARFNAPKTGRSENVDQSSENRSASDIRNYAI